jgi:hypothetical protein
MADDERDLPTTNQPLHGERRPLAPALLGVIALVLAVVGIFALITLVRYVT